MIRFDTEIEEGEVRFLDMCKELNEYECIRIIKLDPETSRTIIKEEYIYGSFQNPKFSALLKEGVIKSGDKLIEREVLVFPYYSDENKILSLLIHEESQSKFFVPWKQTLVGFL